MEHNKPADNITIRNDLRPGDIGYVIHLHGSLYYEEYGYGISFESYVAAGLHEFVQNYNPDQDCVWICEDGAKIVGFLLLMARGNGSAQLRYFLLLPPYRGIGIGKKLMHEFRTQLELRRYKHVYLWTTNEQHAAAELYKKAGFEEIPNYPPYDKMEKSICMEKQLL